MAYKIGSWVPGKTAEELSTDPLRVGRAILTQGLSEAPSAFGKQSQFANPNMGPPGGATPKLAQQENTYASAAGVMAPLQQQLAQQLYGMYGTGAGQMSGLMNQLQQQTKGDFGPGGSLAQQVLQQGLSKNIGDIRTQLASQRGLSPALAASIAATKQAELGGQTTQQAGILGLQQQLAAQNALAGLSQGAATMGAEGATKIGGQLTQADLESKKIQAGISQANQAAAAADKGRTVQLGSAGIGALGQIGAAAVAAAHGGRIDGEAPYAGDTPKNDIVSAKLSPGEIVIPRSAAGSKKAAKSFIESLDDWDEEPSYSKVLKARQKKNYSDGGQVAFPMSGPYAPVTQEKLDAATDKPLPAAQRLKTNIDDFLTGNVVEPLTQRGYPNLGAALATVPSVAAEMMIPSTTGELQAGVIPFPGAKLTKAAKDALKAEGKGAKVLEGLEEKMARKIQEVKPTTSLEKDSWFDDIGGSQGIKNNLDQLAKLNPDDTKISRLTDQIKKFSRQALENENYDIRMSYQKYRDKAMDDLIDHIDAFQSEIKLPQKPKNFSIDELAEMYPDKYKPKKERDEIVKNVKEFFDALDSKKNKE
jgi:hypothetical protein